MKKRITLGMQIDQLVSGYARLLLAGVAARCTDHDVNLIVFSGRILRSPLGHQYQNTVIYDYIRPGTIDALVMATGTQCAYQSTAEFRDYTRRFGAIPLVSIGIRIEGVPSILIDNRIGILGAMAHLVEEHGFRRIAFLKGPAHNPEADARFAAYREALHAWSLADDPAFCMTGDFNTAGARLALDAYLSRHHAPEFQALVAANDEMAMAAAQLLGERGYAVPRDVAIVGFDNILTSQFALPPVTTVDQSLYEQGRSAVDCAMRLLRAEEVPPEVILPTRLVLRTSCGCLPRSVVELGALSVGPGRSGASSDARAISDRCCARLADKGFAERVSRNALIPLIERAGTDDFLRALQDVLIEEIARKEDTSHWQVLLNALQEELVSLADSGGEVTRLGAGFQKARMLLAEMLRLEQGKGLTDLQNHLHSLRSIMERLISVASIDELMGDLADELPRVDITTCFIAGYSAEIRHGRTDTWVIPARAAVMLACVDGKRRVLRETERFFAPAECFVPAGFLPESRRYTLIATSMYFREDQIGYLVFEPGDRDNSVYEAFSVQLSNILKGSLLFTARQKVEERLREVLADLEQYNQELSGLSQTDELTGLYNRRGFLNFGKQSLAIARRMGKEGSLFFVDLDDLKLINDTYGHQEGDLVIQQAAKTLTATFRRMDIIARLGGDEFAVLAINTTPGFFDTLRKRVNENLAVYNSDAGKGYRISMSIGAVEFDTRAPVSLEELLGRADEVLYAEKKRRKEAKNAP
ncbi:MAG: GGDEF domain-containing protein [Spirochaetia bacterium]|jgi:diguanylate cyclase (GGDEF)-like protein